MKITQASLVLSALFFSVFFFNVVLGAFLASAFLSDVGEALTLFVSVLLFVVAMRDAEKRAS